MSTVIVTYQRLDMEHSAEREFNTSQEAAHFAISVEEEGGWAEVPYEGDD